MPAACAGLQQLSSLNIIKVKHTLPFSPCPKKISALPFAVGKVIADHQVFITDKSTEQQRVERFGANSNELQ